MKTFFRDTASVSTDTPPESTLTTPRPIRHDDLPAVSPVRIAIYDALTAPPRVEEVIGDNERALIEALSSRAYQLSHDAGGSLPYVVIREVVENLIHAQFDEVVVSVLDHGNTLRFADQGPGIHDKDRAFQPGFSTATEDMKRVIKGVGSGLPVAKECLSFAGGTIVIEDNLERGTVVTLKATSAQKHHVDADDDTVYTDAPQPSLSTRQKRVLSLTMELGSVGPTIVSKELSVGLSTAYRDLASLETIGLICSDETGKRTLTNEGVRCLDTLFNG